MAPVLETKKVFKTYYTGGSETPVLKGISLKVQKGEFVALMGESGCGKSTWLQIAAMLDLPTSGRVLINGEDTSDLSDSDRARLRREKIGFIFQQFNLLPEESAKSNVGLPLEYAGVSSKEREKRAIKALESVGLGSRVNNRPSELSGGQRQRVAIARALVNEPAIIFADEPCANLDSKSGDEVIEILVKLSQMGNTIVMVTHHAYHYKLTTRIVRMKDEVIVEDKPNTPVSLAEAKGGAPAQAPAPEPMMAQPAMAQPAMAPYQAPAAAFAGYQPPPAPLPRAVARAGTACPKCATDNRPVAQYCRACGFRLALTPSMTQELRLRLAGADLQCSACGSNNRPLAKFCHSCGKPTINSHLPLGAGFR